MANQILSIQGIAGVSDLIKQVCLSHPAKAMFKTGVDLLEDATDNAYPLVFLEEIENIGTAGSAASYAVTLLVADYMASDPSPEQVLLAKSKTEQILMEVHVALQQLQPTQFKVSDINCAIFRDQDDDKVVVARGEFTVEIARYTAKKNNVGGVIFPAIPTYGSGTLKVEWDAILNVPATLKNVDSALASKADAAHSHPEYITGAEVDQKLASAVVGDHEHAGYVTDAELASALSAKADATHTHTGYVTDAELDTALASKASATHAHPEYATDAEVDSKLAGKADKVHTHAWDAITGKPGSYNPTIHSHAIADVSGLQNALDSKSASNHTHQITQVTGLENALNSKASATHAHDYSDLENIPTSFTPSAHTHSEYALKTEIPAQPDLTPYALKTELPDTSGMVKSVNNAIPDANGNVTLEVGDVSVDWTEVENKPLTFAPDTHTHEEYALKSEVPAQPDLTPYALKTELPDTTGMVKSVNSQLPDAQGNVIIAVEAGTVDWSTITGKPTEFKPESHVHEEYALKTDIPVIPEPVDLSGYALKTDIPAPQDLSGYALKSELDAKAEADHTHDYHSLENIPTSFTPAEHQHSEYALKSELPAEVDLTPYALKSELEEKADSDHTHEYSSLLNIPTTFNPAAHTHPWNDITGKPADYTPSAHTHPWTDLTGVPTSFTPSAHSHPATDITQSATHRFVSDTEKTTWNDKAEANHTHNTLIQHEVVYKDANIQPLDFGHELKMDIITTAGGSVNYPVGYGKLISFGVRYTTGNAGAFQIVTGDTGAPHFRITDPNTANYWGTWQQFASREWVTGQNFAAGTHNHDTAYAAKTHTHAISDITNLQTELNSKAASGHSHTFPTLQMTSPNGTAYSVQISNNGVLTVTGPNAVQPINTVLQFQAGYADTMSVSGTKSITYLTSETSNVASFTIQKNGVADPLPTLVEIGDVLTVSITRTDTSLPAYVTLKNF